MIYRLASSGARDPQNSGAWADCTYTSEKRVVGLWVCVDMVAPGRGRMFRIWTSSTSSECRKDRRETYESNVFVYLCSLVCIRQKKESCARFDLLLETGGGNRWVNPTNNLEQDRDKCTTMWGTVMIG